MRSLIFVGFFFLFSWQAVVDCDVCDGAGALVRAKDLCKDCEGNMVTEECSLVKVDILPGSADGERLIFEGQGNSMPGMRQGDLVVVVVHTPHSIFKRQGKYDLVIHHPIHVADALCGCDLTLTHLDGRQMKIVTPPNKCIRPGDVWALEGEGMVKRENRALRGDLLIQFDVHFPSSLQEEQVRKVREAFGHDAGPKAGETSRASVHHRNRKRDDHIYELELKEPGLSVVGVPKAPPKGSSGDDVDDEMR